MSAASLGSPQEFYGIDAYRVTNHDDLGDIEATFTHLITGYESLALAQVDRQIRLCQSGIVAGLDQQGDDAAMKCGWHLASMDRVVIADDWIYGMQFRNEGSGERRGDGLRIAEAPEMTDLSAITLK